MDARVHVTIQQCAILLNIPLEELAKAEGECAECLQKQLIEMEHIKMNTKSKHRKKKIAIGAAIGGGAMLIAGLITLPLLLPFITLGVGVTAGAAALLPLVGGMVSTGLVMAGGLLVAGAQIIPLIFAIGGAGLIGYKVAHITEGIKGLFFMFLFSSALFNYFYYYFYYFIVNLFILFIIFLFVVKGKIKYKMKKSFGLSKYQQRRWATMTMMTKINQRKNISSTWKNK